MNDPILLFVYGLLMAGGPGYAALGLDGRVRNLGRERIAGRLYHLGDYPGLVTGPHGLVEGELLALQDPALIETIDAYELYEPANLTASEFRRIETDLLVSGGRGWTYEYNRPVAGRPVIATGCWRSC
jgi:gamma-glutamylcyclotransferase (GGCT)/AIG2-like uncharacterized protein YtfP